MFLYMVAKHPYGPRVSSLLTLEGAERIVKRHPEWKIFMDANFCSDEPGFHTGEIPVRVEWDAASVEWQ